MKMRFAYNSDQVAMYRVKTLRGFERIIRALLYHPEKPYRLFISYKNRHRVKKVAGRCFMWDETEETRNGIELRSLNDASQDDCEGFGNPRFDGVSSAILIADSYVFAYGDVQIEADDISKDKKHVICTVSLCGCIVSFFRIPAEVFDRHFGLEENFPEQYANPVQEENDPIEEAKRNIESCMNLLDTNGCQLERAMDAIKAALMDIEDQKCELGDMLYKLTQKEARREERR